MKHRHVGRHADALNTGAPIGPGEFVELSDKEAKDEPLVKEGTLIPTEASKKTSKEDGE
jgi:hypothetical protein